MGSARLQTCIAAVVGGLFGCTQLASLDLPLALANGDRLLATGEIPRTNVWSWVRPDFAYLNDKWGFDTMVAAANAALGDAGLHSLQALFGAAMGLLLLALCRRVETGWRAVGLALLALTMLSYRLFLRAEWISYLFVAATLHLLPGIVERRRAAAIAFLVIVPPAAACHAYWFLGPVIVLVAGAAERSLRTLLIGVAGIAAGAISPFGVANVFHPFAIAGQVTGSGLTDAISELRPPFAGGLATTFFHVLALVLAVASAAAVVELLRTRRWRDAAVLGVLLAVALRFDRNLAMLGLAMPLAAAAVVGRTIASGAGAAVAATALAAGAAGVPWFLAGREPGLRWQEELFPRRIAAELGTSGPGSRYVNDLSIGSYLVRARGEAFIDGNTHGYLREFLAEYRRALTGETGVDAIDAKYANDGWLLRHNLPTTREMILGLFLGGDHAPQRWDDVATLFAKDDDPERADAQWRRWLADVWLPVALPWFPSDAEVALATKGDPDWGRKAAVLCPWRRRYYEEMARRYAELGDLANAGRCLRYASRFQ